MQRLMYYPINIAAVFIAIIIIILSLKVRSVLCPIQNNGLSFEVWHACYPMKAPYCEMQVPSQSKHRMQLYHRKCILHHKTTMSTDEHLLVDSMCACWDSYIANISESAAWRGNVLNWPNLFQKCPVTSCCN